MVRYENEVMKALLLAGVNSVVAVYSEQMVLFFCERGVGKFIKKLCHHSRSLLIDSYLRHSTVS
jgi:hypothetical protein